MDFKMFSFSEIIRYFMAGFIFIVFVASPLIINKNYDVFIELKKTSATIILASSFVFGFLVDQLKIYQWIYGYNRIKKSFRKNLAAVLGIEMNMINTNFSLITKISHAIQDEFDLEKKRAEWMLAINTSVMLIFVVVFWIILFYFDYLPSLNYYLFIFYILLAIKLYLTATKELEKSNKEFILFCKIHKNEILTKLKENDVKNK